MQYHKQSHRLLILFVLIALVATAAACGGQEPAPTAVAEVAPTVPAEPPATWTPIPLLVGNTTSQSEPTLPPPPTSTPLPTATLPPPTATPEATATEVPTETPVPPPTAVPVTAVPATAAPPAPPTLSPNPTLGSNLLPNPSFEEGHYLQNGISELQLPNGWRIEYREDATGFGGQVWDVYVRPETRVLSTRFLPPEEHGLYIFDGSQTVKIFKGNGAVNARLLTEIDLQPGTYILEGNFFSDVFERYENRQKFAPADNNAAEAALFAGGTGTGWIGNNYLNKNNIKHTFTLDTAQRVTVGIGFRGRYALANNGWFVDNLSLRQVQ